MSCLKCKLNSAKILLYCQHQQCERCFNNVNLSRDAKSLFICSCCEMIAPDCVTLVEARNFGEGFFHYQSALKYSSDAKKRRAYLLGSRYFELCVAENPRNYYSMSNLGRCYMEALTTDLQAVMNDPLNHFLPEKSLGNKAITALSKVVVELKPDCIDSLKKISLLYQLSRDPFAAMEYLMRLKSEKLNFDDSDTADGYDLEGMIKTVHDSINNSKKRRFQVGDRVKCRCDGVWKEGTVYRLNWRGDDDSKYFRTAAYQIRLNNAACRCKWVCSCGALGLSGSFVYCTFDVEENVTKADECRVSSKIAGPKSTRKQQIKTGMIEIAVVKSKVLQLLSSVSAASGSKWLKNYPFEHLMLTYTRLITPRRRTFNLNDPDSEATAYSMIDNDSAAQVLAEFIGTEGISTLEAKAAEGCADSTLKLGDVHMFALHMKQNQKDHMKACDYYYQAGDLNQPEACVALAMMGYAQLFTHLAPHEVEYNLPAPEDAPGSTCFKQMWYWAERAALQDYKCPFLLLLADHYRDRDFVPAAVVTLQRRHEEALTRELKVKKSTCCNPNCSSSGEKKLMVCNKCKSANYCNRECQISDWPRHKPECKMFLRMGNLTIDATSSTGDTEFEKAIDMMRKI